MRLGLFLLALGAALLGAACGGAVSEGDDLARGRELFLQGDGGQGEAACASCHTLAAAPSAGTVGPNLDDAFRRAREEGFEESTFEQVVREQIRNPGVGSVMQPNLIEGENADNVAYFIARCGGNADDPACKPPGGGEITATDGAMIFSEAGCGGCHTLAAAGSSGTVGPNLDESKAARDLVVDRITNGKGAMPAFADRLSEEQIQAVADYVVQSTGG